jgi:hypothetical protein
MAVPNTFVAGTVANPDDVNENFEYLLDMIVPVGGIIPWAKSLTGVPALTDNFVECNGQTLSDGDSPLDGQVIPDLNGDARFLYGASTSGGTKTENFLPNHNHTIPTVSGATLVLGGTGSSTGTVNTGSKTEGTAWVGYAVVMIMRVK